MTPHGANLGTNQRKRCASKLKGVSSPPRGNDTLMQNKWLLYLALGFFVVGIMGWTRTAYYLWTNPDAYNEREGGSWREPQPQAPLGGSNEEASGHKGQGTERTRESFNHGDGVLVPGEKVVQRALAQLASLTQAPREAIAVVEVRERVWPDSSLGCPKPGMAYIQIPHDGHSILLEAGGRLYRFHSGPEGEPFLCDDPPHSGAQRIGEELLTGRNAQGQSRKTSF